jgi:hypothetical protein
VLTLLASLPASFSHVLAWCVCSPPYTPLMREGEQEALGAVPFPHRWPARWTPSRAGPGPDFCKSEWVLQGPLYGRKTT